MNSLTAGLAAEFLVCHDLLCAGVLAGMSTFPHSNYDILAQIGDRFLRVQVKSTARMVDAQTPQANNRHLYRFRFNGDTKNYAGIDLFCFVHIPTKGILYVAPSELNVRAYEVSYLASNFPQLAHNSLLKFLKRVEDGTA